MLGTLSAWRTRGEKRTRIKVLNNGWHGGTLLPATTARVEYRGSGRTLLLALTASSRQDRGRAGRTNQPLCLSERSPRRAVVQERPASGSGVRRWEVTGGLAFEVQHGAQQEVGADERIAAFKSAVGARRSTWCWADERRA